jgi:hypothetical protein
LFSPFSPILLCCCSCCQDLAQADLTKTIKEERNKLKLSQNLYEQVKSQRNKFSKEQIRAQDEIAELKRKFKVRPSLPPPLFCSSSSVSLVRFCSFGCCSFPLSFFRSFVLCLFVCFLFVRL